MLAALYALLFGGVAAFAGGSGGGTSTPVSLSPRQDDDDTNTPAASSDPDPTVFAPLADLFSPTPVALSAPPASDTPSAPNSAYQLGWGGLTAEEQLVVELVNRARMDPDSELARQSDGYASGVTSAPKEALAVVPSLSEASRAHSEDMDNRDFFAHNNLDGQSPSDRAIEEGHGSRFVGENIGWIGSSFTGFDRQSRTENHHDNLWESDGHQQNFMSDRWSEIGVGYDYGSYRGYDGSTFVTEMFSDRGDTYLTGVVIEDGDNDRFYDIGEGQGAVRITATAADGKMFTTSSWDAGGYTLKLPAGTYNVRFEGGDLDAPYSTTVTIGSENVKLDVIDPGAGGGTAVSAAFVPDPTFAESGNQDSATLPSIPVPEEQIAVQEDEEPELELVLL